MNNSEALASCRHMRVLILCARRMVIDAIKEHDKLTEFENQHILNLGLPNKQQLVSAQSYFTSELVKCSAVISDLDAVDRKIRREANSDE